MQPVRSQLAVSGLEQATFKVTVVWPADLFSRHLHQDADAIEPVIRLLSHSVLCR
jgi:hypothetical protein